MLARSARRLLGAHAPIGSRELDEIGALNSALQRTARFLGHGRSPAYLQGPLGQKGHGRHKQERIQSRGGLRAEGQQL